MELVEALKNEFQQANIYVWLDCFVDFKRPSMTLTSCRALFQEALHVFGRLILIRIPFNPYNHISKEWILEEITVIFMFLPARVSDFDCSIKTNYRRMYMKQLMSNGSTVLSEILYEGI